MQVLTLEEVKKHPMYQILVATVGEKSALEIIRKRMDEETKENQATTEFSKTSKKIIIPDSMNKLQASKELERQWDDEETVIEVSRDFSEWNWKDVLVAVKKTAEKHFGWIQGKTEYTFFGPKRPQEISVVTNIVNGQKITEECFYGSFTVTAWEGCTIKVNAEFINATVKKRYADEVREFLAMVQEHLDTSSIYRGKAVTVTQQTDPWGNVSLNFEIFELKVSSKIILNEEVETVLNNFLLDDLGAAGKRAALFSGGYGNAKTETAMLIGKQGLAKGMVFFYCKDAAVFHMLLRQAMNYQPSIVFMEDVDEIGAGEQRDADMNRILNTLDGVQTKNHNLTVIFTTNHEQRINPALRRPGRIDLVINFANPDKISVAKIYKIYSEELVNNLSKENMEDIDWNKLAERTPDASGAVVAEIAKRAVKLCLKRRSMKEEYFKAAIDSMKHHMKLMTDPVEQKAQGDMVIMVKNGNIHTAPVENVTELMNANSN